MSGARRMTDPTLVSRVRATRLTSYVSDGWSSTGLLLEYAGEWVRVAVHEERFYVSLGRAIVEVDPTTTQRLLSAEVDRLLLDSGIPNEPHPGQK